MPLDPSSKMHAGPALQVSPHVPRAQRLAQPDLSQMSQVRSRASCCPVSRGERMCKNKFCRNSEKNTANSQEMPQIQKGAFFEWRQKIMSQRIPGYAGSPRQNQSVYRAAQSRVSIVPSAKRPSIFLFAENLNGCRQKIKTCFATTLAIRGQMPDPSNSTKLRHICFGFTLSASTSQAQRVWAGGQSVCVGACACATCLFC